MALAIEAQSESLERLLSAVQRFNRLDPIGTDWGFYEYAQAHSGEALGVRKQVWSAAGQIFLHSSFSTGKQLFCFRLAPPSSP